MTIHGDLYYEGKEFETRMKDKKPGELSDDLRTALGMPVGPTAHRVPPPWLIAMQRYGPPPSYPHLKIPGLNAPIPDGCSFGYHAGGWGKPPVDEMGRPLYGDVFGITNQDDSVRETQFGIYIFFYLIYQTYECFYRRLPKKKQSIRIYGENLSPKKNPKVKKRRKRKKKKRRRKRLKHQRKVAFKHRPKVLLLHLDSLVCLLV